MYTHYTITVFFLIFDFIGSVLILSKVFAIFFKKLQSCFSKRLHCGVGKVRDMQVVLL